MNTKTVVLLLATLSCGVAFAQESALGIAQRPNVGVQGDAEILVDPDYAVLRLSVQHFGTDVVGVRDQSQAAVMQLLADARALGIAAPDLASTPSMVFPGRWQCSNCSDAEKESGHTAHTSVTITLRRIATLADLVARLSSDKHVLLQDVEYHTTALRQHRDRARALAMQAAREKAQALSSEIGQTIGKALSIAEQLQLLRVLFQPRRMGPGCDVAERQCRGRSRGGRGHGRRSGRAGAHRGARAGVGVVRTAVSLHSFFFPRQRQVTGFFA